MSEYPTCVDLQKKLLGVYRYYYISLGRLEGVHALSKEQLDEFARLMYHMSRDELEYQLEKYTELIHEMEDKEQEKDKVKVSKKYHTTLTPERICKNLQDIFTKN